MSTQTIRTDDDYDAWLAEREQETVRSLDAIDEEIALREMERDGTPARGEG